ncbi:unnamed protein product [Protopolystoma xenopodis]|uniref:Uncharacterized protein n=1 Tax=Protopolystoma xenopodis TaxID=117903 RepID=A0A448XS01_9PLAT|nr:unnamed protein product [Protopolystoma xenopodis]
MLVVSAHRAFKSHPIFLHAFVAFPFIIDFVSLAPRDITRQSRRLNLAASSSLLPVRFVVVRRKEEKVKQDCDPLGRLHSVQGTVLFLCRSKAVFNSPKHTQKAGLDLLESANRFLGGKAIVLLNEILLHSISLRFRQRRPGAVARMTSRITAAAGLRSVALGKKLISDFRHFFCRLQRAKVLRL